jgi:hypothetical protein
MYFSLVLQLANIVQANHTEKKWECFGFLYMMSSFASTTNNLKSYPVIRNRLPASCYILSIPVRIYGPIDSTNNNNSGTLYTTSANM